MQGLKGTSWFKMFGLNPLANITLRDVPSNFSLHASPPKSLLEILIHFCTTWVNGKLRTVGFIKDNSPELMILWHHNSLPKEYNSLIISRETPSFALPH